MRGKQLQAGAVQQVTQGGRRVAAAGGYQFTVFSDGSRRCGESPSEAAFP